MPDFGDAKVNIRVIERDEGKGECNRIFCADEIEFRRGQLQVGFLLGVFSLVNDVTKRTRMRPIERLRNCLAQRTAFRIIDDHRSPRDGLERQPMQPDCAAKGENCDDATNAAKHSEA